MNIFKRIKKLWQLAGEEEAPAAKPNVIKIAAGLCIFRVQGHEEKAFARQLSDRVREMHFELPDGYIIKEIVVEKK